jgi:TetR/AcrR family transcriptional regulator
MQVGKAVREVHRPASRKGSLGTRQAILAASLDEFADKGFDGARVEEIAMRAGVNKNALYHHFGNKDDLFTAVLENIYEQIRTRQQDLQIRNLPPILAMRKLVIFTGRVWIQFPQFQRLLHSESLHGARHIRGSKKIAELYNPLLPMLNEMLRR